MLSGSASAGLLLLPSDRTRSKVPACNHSASGSHVLTILVPQHRIAAPHHAGVHRGHDEGGPPHAHRVHAVNAKAIMPVRSSPAGAAFQLEPNLT